MWVADEKLIINKLGPCHFLDTLIFQAVLGTLPVWLFLSFLPIIVLYVHFPSIWHILFGLYYDRCSYKKINKKNSNNCKYPKKCWFRRWNNQLPFLCGPWSLAVSNPVVESLLVLLLETYQQVKEIDSAENIETITLELSLQNWIAKPSFPGLPNLQFLLPITIYKNIWKGRG